MLSTRIRALIHRQWAGLIALFLVLTGGSAYALDGQNTVFTDDIVDGQVKTADIGNGEVKVADIGQAAVATEELKNDAVTGAKVAAGTLTTTDVKNETLNAADVAPNSLPSGRILDGSLTGADVKDNALKGADIDEATLDVGDAARAYARVFAFCTTNCEFDNAKGISSVTRSDPGTFCVTAPWDQPTRDAGLGDGRCVWHRPHHRGRQSAMTVEFPSFGCGPSGQGFRVRTERHPVTADGALASAVPSDEVAFTIVIP
jgi:hypothetical protein